MVRVRYFEDDIGGRQGFAIKEEDATGELVAVDLTGKTVVIKFLDRDGNTATISGSDVVITSAANGEGYYVITATITATAGRVWDTVQAKVTEGATYIEHSDPIVVIIGEIAG